MPNLLSRASKASSPALGTIWTAKLPQMSPFFQSRSANSNRSPPVREQLTPVRTARFGVSKLQLLLFCLDYLGCRGAPHQTPHPSLLQCHDISQHLPEVEQLLLSLLFRSSLRKMCLEKNGQATMGKQQHPFARNGLLGPLIIVGSVRAVSRGFHD